MDRMPASNSNRDELDRLLAEALEGVTSASYDAAHTWREVRAHIEEHQRTVQAMLDRRTLADSGSANGLMLAPQAWLLEWNLFSYG